ncbi:MAG: hypothetical protein EOP04_00200 [Proteobacteria bacterium]|nr:MAG: hypothetical protein EOP04_00200 [Pseudomonadota bacterium]
MNSKAYPLALVGMALTISCSNSNFNGAPSSKTVGTADTTNNSSEPNSAKEPYSSEKNSSNDSLGNSPSKQISTMDSVTSVPATDAVFKKCENSVSSHFQADLYRLEEGKGFVPDFSKLTSSGKVCLDQLNITRRDFTQGFPGVDALFEWFALKIVFDLQITSEGDYEFFLSSDDGTLMSLDGVPVINNDGQHDVVEKTAKVHLLPGKHRVDIGYFQGSKYAIALEMKWQTPDSKEKTYIPTTLISRPQ